MEKEELAILMILWHHKFNPVITVLLIIYIMHLIMLNLAVDNTMKLKISFWNQLKMLTGLIVMTIPYAWLIYLGWYFFEVKFKMFLLAPYFVMFFIPVVCIHIRYYNKNRLIIFTINPNSILKEEEGEIIEYKAEDIKEIIFYMGGSRNRGNGGLAHSDYYYAKIELNDGSFFIITSLCSSKIDKILKENFKDVQITTNKVFYPMV